MLCHIFILHPNVDWMPIFHHCWPSKSKRATKIMIWDNNNLGDCYMSITWILGRIQQPQSKHQVGDAVTLFLRIPVTIRNRICQFSFNSWESWNQTNWYWHGTVPWHLSPFIHFLNYAFDIFRRDQHSRVDVHNNMFALLLSSVLNSFNTHSARNLGVSVFGPIQTGPSCNWCWDICRNV